MHASKSLLPGHLSAHVMLYIFLNPHILGQYLGDLSQPVFLQRLCVFFNKLLQTDKLYSFFHNNGVLGFYFEKSNSSLKFGSSLCLLSGFYRKQNYQTMHFWSPWLNEVYNFGQYCTWAYIYVTEHTSVYTSCTCVDKYVGSCPNHMKFMNVLSLISRVPTVKLT